MVSGPVFTRASPSTPPSVARSFEEADSCMSKNIDRNRANEARQPGMQWGATLTHHQMMLSTLRANPIELSSIGSPRTTQSRGMATRGASPAVSSAAKASAMTSFSFMWTTYPLAQASRSLTQPTAVETIEVARLRLLRTIGSDP